MNNLVYKNNQRYWEKENQRDTDNGMLLYENYYNDAPQICYGISKVALCLAKCLNLTPGVLLPWKESKLSMSMCQKQFQIKNRLAIIALKHCIHLLHMVITVNREKLLALNYGDDLIGPYMYDAIIRKFNKKTISSLSLRERAYICFEICYYFYFLDIFNKLNIKVVVLGDNVYRYGYLFEICKNRNITCYSPIDLNTMFLRKFSKSDDFKSNYLSKVTLQKLCLGRDYRSIVKDYFDRRYSGNIQQHDVLTAYANKEVSTEDEFRLRYKIDPSKKTVIIMSHVFADAPHVYTDALYDDYWIWFEQTFECLLQNKNINLLVKEHPSAHLYGQKGLVTDFLRKKGLESLQIVEKESTLSILQNVDTVVTCGGTIGIEIAYFGKNVVLASKPPYANVGFTTGFDSRAKYEEFLINDIQNLKPLTYGQKEIAIQTAYVLFCRANNWNPNLELGGEIIYMGKEYDVNVLYSNIIKYNNVSLENQEIFKLIKKFVSSNNNEFFSD